MLDQEYYNGRHFVASLIISIFAFVGGMGAHFFTQGLNPNSRWPKLKKYTIRPFVKNFVFPTLLAQLIWGALARNGLQPYMTDWYYDKWAGWFRNVGAALILLRTGLELDFKGKGILMPLFATIPSIAEAIVAAVIANQFLNFSWPLAFSLGFFLSAVSPSILVPGLIKMKEGNYGMAKGIPTLMLASAGLSITMAVAIFSICNEVALNEARPHPKEINALVGDIFKEIGVGLANALVFSILAWPFKKSPNMVRAFIVFAGTIFMMGIYNHYKWSISNLLGQIFFGFGLRTVWKDKVPGLEIKYFWFCSMPFFFGNVGSQVDLAKISKDMVGNSAFIILVAIAARMFFTGLVVSIKKEYNLKEKIFCAISWIPKATIQASYGGAILSKLKDEKLTALSDQANYYLTISLLSIIFAAPVGAILIENLGPILLSNEKLEEVKKAELKLPNETNETLVPSDKKTDPKEVEMAEVKLEEVPV